MIRPYIPVFDSDFGDAERTAIHQHIATDKFITAGKHVTGFEKEFGAHIGRRYCTMVNSGSSALLVAVKAMGWKPGDKVITPAVTFPTTIAPLLHFGITPVFVDVEEATYNIDPAKTQETIRRVDGIVGAVIPHTLGNPVDPMLWMLFADTVEDACDAFGSEIHGRKCGTFGTVSTFSFFPAHHITTGEGGMVCTAHEQLNAEIVKYVNWGRACWCKPGFDSTCGKRLDYEVDGIPYDHKYAFDVAGFNLKPLDLCGVIGRVQLAKAERFKQTRARNFEILDRGFAEIEDLVIRPKALPEASPCFFGYPITLRKGNRAEITKRIEEKGVATRLVFGGNITRQPMMKGMEIIAPCGLEQSDKVMSSSYIVGCNHTITEEEAHYIVKTNIEAIKDGI